VGRWFDKSHGHFEVSEITSIYQCSKKKHIYTKQTNALYKKETSLAIRVDYLYAEAKMLKDKFNSNEQIK